MRDKIISACESDGEQMLEIIESSGTKGNFELIYTRRPNPYLSYMHESTKVKIGVNKSNDGKIKYQAVNVINRCFVNGKAIKAGYITGLKKSTQCSFFDGFEMAKFLHDDNCEVFYCSFLNSNEKGKNVFLKHRKYFPDLIKLCDYRTYIFNPNQFAARKRGSTTFRTMENKDKDAVTEFLNKESKKYNFAVEISDIKGQFYGLKAEDCYILEDRGKIVAFGALWDRTEDKQYIVKKYSLGLKILKSMPFLIKALGYIPLPDENISFRFPILSFMYAENNNKKYYEEFLSEVCSKAQKKYDIVTIGMDIKNSNTCIFDSIKKLSFDSSIYYLSFDKKIKADLKKVCSIECALL